MEPAEFDKRLKAYLETEGVLAIAVALKRGACTRRQLEERSGFSGEFVKKVRDRMSNWGLVKVEALNGKTQLISLTPAGEKFVALVFRQVELMDGDSEATRRS